MRGVIPYYEGLHPKEAYELPVYDDTLFCFAHRKRLGKVYNNRSNYLKQR